jgi:hypothetical protein
VPQPQAGAAAAQGAAHGAALVYTIRYVVYGTTCGRKAMLVTGRYATVGQPLHGSRLVTAWHVVTGVYRYSVR